MCGIAGVLALSDLPPDPAWGRLLVERLAHRGPDHADVYHDSRLVLAHTRLAIIDTSDAGCQPMTSAHGEHVLIVNAGDPGSLTEQRWWRLPEPDPAQRANAAWFATLESELLEATRLRTVSDVPIGVFLSGGMDSNTVLEHLVRIGHRPIRTFTVGF